MKMKHVISLTYQIKAEGKLFVVRCLDWDCVFSQGSSIDECKKNVTELTSYYLNELITGKLHKTQYPVLKSHKASIYNFQLDFDIRTTKHIETEKLKTFKNITPAEKRELAFA